MVTVRKVYELPFVLDQSKLTRLLEVIRERLCERSKEVGERFEAHLSGQRTVQANSIDEITSLDNSRRSRIEELLITLHTTPANGHESECIVRIDFDGRSPVDVSLSVTNENSSWVQSTASAIEEQLERTFQNDLVYKLKKSDFVLPLFAGVAMLFAIVATALTVVLPTSSGPRAQISENMWLTKADIEEFAEKLDGTPVLGSEDTADLLTRQVRNVIDQSNDPSSGSISGATIWRIAFIGIPLILVGSAVVYLVLLCYPAGVFLWGDAAEWYESILNRRKTIWLLVVLAMVIGVFANLFAFGLGGFIEV